VVRRTPGVSEFNRSRSLRKIAPDRFLRSRRVFKNARWIDQLFPLHVLDHPERHEITPPQIAYFDKRPRPGELTSRPERASDCCRSWANSRLPAACQT
jgi:hypothetical protein